MKKKKNICFVLPVFQCGGIERVFLNIVNYLDSKKYSPSLIILDTSHLYKEWLPRTLPTYLMNKKGRFDFIRILYLLVFNVFPEIKPDLVVSFAEYANLMSLVAAKLYRRNLPVIVTEHNVPSVALKHTRLWRIKWSLIRHLYLKSNKIIPVSNQIKNDLTRHFSIPEEKLTVIYNPINFSLIRDLSKESIVDFPYMTEVTPVITACGRLTEQKNYPLLLHAFADVLKKQDARLVILGDGDKRVLLSQLAVHLKIHPYVHFLGVQDNPFRFLARSDVYVLSSSWEGFPNSLIEAMACDVASISTRCPSGIEEIIHHGVDGILVPTNDKQSLTEAMLKLLSDKTFRKKIADEGRRKVEALGIEKIIHLYEREFEIILSKVI